MIEDVDALLRSVVDEDAALGIAYGVVDRTGLVHAAGHGVIGDGGRRPDPSTAFRIASMSKSFTAAAVLLLAERGALCLADPVSRHVPEFAAVRLPTSDSPQITVEMLLSMSAGLPTDDPWADRQESMSREEFGRLLASGLRFVSTPGTAYEYSNLGYAILGRVVEAASGECFQGFVRDHLIHPLGLTSTGYDTSVKAPGGVATGHVRLDGRWQALPFSEPGVFSAIGGLFSTVEDLALWVRWLADAFPARDGEDPGPLSRASRRAMQQVQCARPPAPHGPVGYGYGLVIHHEPEWGTVVSHGGGYPGFGSHMRWHPATGLGVINLTNARYVSAHEKVEEALRTVLAAAVDPPGPAELWPETSEARTVVERLLREWDGALAGAWLAENVAMDLDLARRRNRIGTLIEDVGPLLEPSDALLRTDSPAHAVWEVRGVRGSLRCEIRLTPQDPPKIQTLSVRRLGAAEAARARKHRHAT
ncbi:serine hydrolase domain-containing protein [Actinoallomurus iriomotensis]|uniref:Penicillin-binding protein n=1 Tax=Actinoallomurus iriomotensis TaxID=478107 RepID=A0A9W6RF68_9ACTN|nr:serine hydrolase domain-containing protein [Actinoallomurus iriomotensis]GLY74719.1 penicillin-binding protein [Actinoallomurus iriomotensis]